MSRYFYRHVFVSMSFLAGVMFVFPLYADGGLQVGLSTSVVAGVSTVGDASLSDIQSGGHDPVRNGFSLPGVELSLGSAVDPYFDAQANIVVLVDAEGETIVELEEAFAITRSLPQGLQLKAGQFYTEFGRHNTQHPHAWAFVDQPVIASRLLGPDGLRSQGVRLSWLVPLPWYSEVYTGLQNAKGETTVSFIGSGSGHAHGGDEQEASFAEFPLVERSVNGPEDFLYSARWLNGVDMSDSVSANLGVSVLVGPNNTGDATETRILGTDLYLKWQSQHSNKGFPFLAWHSEFMTRSYQAGSEQSSELLLSDTGLFTQLQWGITPGWVLGVRYELANGNDVHYEGGAVHEDESADPLRDLRQRVAASISFLPTEFSRLRLQYNNDQADHLHNTAHSIWLQLEYNIGAHMAHKF